MRPRTRRALIVAATASPAGTHDHADDVRADVEALGSALTDAAFDEIRALDDPGRTRMLEELRSFCAVAEPTDVLVVALNGTIVRGGDGRLYFPAASRGRRLAPGAVRLDAVSEVIQTSPARSTVVLLDCDYSGWFDDGPDGLTSTVPQFDLRRAFPGDGCAVFAASGGGHHGPDSLSQGVARALRGAAPDRDGDGWIDTADLDEYLRRTRAVDRPPVLVTDAPSAPLARHPHRTSGPVPLGRRTETRPDPRSLLADLTAVEDLDVARFGDTALASLTHTPEPGRAEPSIPVSTAEVSEAHHRAVESAMTRRLTVVAAPPGNGAATLAAAAAHTAIASGQNVLFVAADTASADAFTVDVRTEVATAYLAVRADAPGHSRTVSRTPGASRRRSGKAEDGEAAARAALYRDWAAVCVARAAIDAIARIERDLTLLAEARGQIIAAGWDPKALFRGKPPGEWLRLDEQATGRLSLRPLRRSAARRRLASATDPAVLDRVCQIARVEQEWAAALDTRRRATALEELYADLVAALEAHRWSSAAYLAARSRPDRHGTVRAGRPERAGSGCDGDDRLPVWAVGVGQAHELPMRAGLFDLVIVDGADRYGVDEVLPLLYRARRALVVGDPAATAFTADAGGQRCAEPSASAYRALARIRTETGGRVLWLDEHNRCHPEIAALADRCCYGGRGTALTDPRTLPGDTARPVQWHDVRGEYEPDPEGSFVNREEAHRAAAVLTALDVRLPVGATVGVTSPFPAQRALLRRLTGRRRYSREIRIEAPHGFGARPCDALVVSPVLSGPNPHRTVARTLATPQWWHPVLTGTVAQFVVVGDRRFWQEGKGVPAALVEAATARPGAAAVPRPLLQALGDLSAEVELGPLVGGHRVDLCVRTPQGPVLVLVDRTRDGRGLRRLLDRRQRLQETTDLPVLRVPFWRCLHDPEDLAKEILLGRV
ncbi:DNA/RNA helicase [Thermobifida halotolerans]|uniref:DNA/RNA helicase n=1 Tax=Thermobifida halotolerans TaxID=483545 RepID=A0A399G5L8_9ACTN|nr:AAA domain-containing protein [Thermobifida halotolerans]UOE19772.1 DNA/RNA helicase [Thermobifida halotolerans]